MKESVLITQVIANDDRAITQLYWQYVPRLRRFFKDRIGDKKDAEEVVHDTFLSVLDALPSFDGKAKLSTWIMGIAKHELVDYYRKKKIKKLLFSRFPFLEKLVDQALGPQLALEEKQLKQRILKTFQKLSEGYALILRLKYVEGLSVAEIAQTLEISYKAAESRLTRARLAFQKVFVETQKVPFHSPQVWDPPLA
jgi:RNA polymerase sigma-70 factor (ECF subfamily)